MAEAKSGNVGSASHMGDNQLPRDSHFIRDYTLRRVPIPVNTYMAVADTPAEHLEGENTSKLALDMLRDLIEPAVITDDELASPHMERLIRDSLAKINSGLLERARQEKVPETMHVSLTFVLADGKRAYVGHVGTNRVYLLHDERLYDLTPTGGFLSAAPSPDEPSLFSVPPEGEAPPAEQPPAPSADRGQFLGQSDYARIGYNEVEISPGDVIILASDGLWKTVSEEELVEHLLSGVNVQRSASQLTRLAFSRDSSDNATMVAWKHAPAGQPVRKDVRDVRLRVRRERTADTLVIALLVLLLAGIFAVGFAFGWRITDAFRKPAKESKKTTETSAIESSATEKTTEKKAEEQSTTQPPQPVTQTATVTAQSARIRATSAPTGQILGTLQKGQQVTVLGEVTGTDGKAWIKAKATVKSGNTSTEVEGFIRKDLVQVTSQPAPAGSATSPAGSATAP